MVYSKVREIMDAVKTLFANKAAVSDLLEWGGKTGRREVYWGLGILLFPPLINVILLKLSSGGGFGLVFFKFVFWPLFVPVLSLILMFLFLVIWLRNESFFRVLSHAAVVLWPSLVPFLLVVLGIFDSFTIYNFVWYLGFFWILGLAGRLLRTKLNLKTDKLVMSLGLAVAVFVLANLILGQILVGSAYRFFY